ncbi:MAG: hypothetical protein MZW92_16630 [Comamonadaceae bacterium]|nr:hypothetical protein [Comamonadaceae bacterium]
MFCEFAVFEPRSWRRIPLLPDAWCWQRARRRPGARPAPARAAAAAYTDETWIVGEALALPVRGPAALAPRRAAVGRALRAGPCAGPADRTRRAAQPRRRPATPSTASGGSRRASPRWRPSCRP